MDHIASHGLRPEHVEELYYGEGPYPTLVIKNKAKAGRGKENRFRLWGTDASGTFIEAIIAPYPRYGLWRCVIAFPMTTATQRLYLRRTRR